MQEMQEKGVQSWVGTILCRRKWKPTPVFMPGKCYGWRSLVGYSPWGLKESDTTEGLSTCTHFTNPVLFFTLDSFHEQLLE